MGKEKMRNHHSALCFYDLFTFACSVVSNPLQPYRLARQAPLSMGCSRQEHWRGLPSPGDLPDPETEPASPESPGLAGGFFTTSAPGRPLVPVNLTILDASCQWHQAIFILLHLNYFIEGNAFQVHPSCRKWHSLVLFKG